MKQIGKLLKIILLSIGFLIVITAIFFGHRDIPMDELKSKYGQDPSAFVSIDGMDVHYRDEGNPTDSIPIVLIHGTGSSLHTFDAWTEKLQKNRRIIRMDLPAYGLTGPFPNRDYAMSSYVDFMHHFLTTLEIESCVLGGNSLGGGIAWNYAVKHPDGVHKLILIDAMGYPTDATSVPIAFKLATVPVIKEAFTFITPRFIAEGSVKNVYADKSKVSEELVDRYFDLTLREGNRQAFVDRLALEAELSAFENIKQIQQPTLILWGDQDQLIPIENAYKFQKDLPNDTLVILENMGHVPMEESPDKSLEAVLAFLGS